MSYLKMLCSMLPLVQADDGEAQACLPPHRYPLHFLKFLTLPLTVVYYKVNIIRTLPLKDE